jgi:phosphoglycerate dehydrogenase-like enzyme
MATRSIAVLSKIPGLVDALAAQLPAVQINKVTEMAGTTADAALVADPSALVDALAAAPKSASLPPLVQLTWAGVNVLWDEGGQLRDERLARTTLVRCAGGASSFGTQASEWVLGHVLSLNLGLRQQAAAQQRAEWVPTESRLTLAGSRVCVLGAGQIGTHVGTTMRAVGCHVDLVTSTTSEADRDVALCTADYVVSILPSTPGTRGFLTSRRLSSLKEGAVWLNLGRGDILESELALTSSLAPHGPLRAAVLDVFPVEPLPPSSSLWANERVIISPHVAAISMANDIATVTRRHWEAYSTGNMSELPVVSVDKQY